MLVSGPQAVKRPTKRSRYTHSSVVTAAAAQGSGSSGGGAAAAATAIAASVTYICCQSGVNGQNKKLPIVLNQQWKYYPFRNYQRCRKYSHLERTVLFIVTWSWRRQMDS